MKKITLLSILLAALLGCSRPETDGTPSSERTFASIPVRFELGLDSGSDSTRTRSAIEIDDDDIRTVALFVFEAASGKICLDASGQPFTTERSSRSFDWELPCNPDGTPLPVEIYTLCNYGSLSLPFSDKALQSSSLDALTYSISSITELGKGMPMAGVDRISLTPSTRSVNLGVKKLFACFFFEFDTSELDAAGLSLQALHLTTHQVNTKVHWFVAGDKAGTTTGLDYASEQDLRYLAKGGDSYIYVLENMQGKIAGASSWRTVQADLGSKVSRCTYVDIGVKVLDRDGLYENRAFQVYLGNGDMVSDFDIPRNLLKTVRVRIPAENPDFSWDRKQITLEPGKSQEVGYKTTFPLSKLRFSTSGSDCTARSTVLGKAVISVSDKVRDGDTFLVEGGSDNSTAVLKVFVKEPTVLSCRWMDMVSYVGYPASFRVEGLQEGETLAEATVTLPKSRVSLDGVSVRYVPGSRWADVVTVKTSLGRSLAVSVPGAIVPELSTDDSVHLSIDGSFVYPEICYVDPTDKRKLDGFDPLFYADYLRVTRNTVRAEGSYPADLVRCSYDGTRMAVFTYHIEGFISGVKVATVTFQPIDFEGLSAQLDAYVDPPGNTPEGLGELHDYSLIPPSGPRAEDEQEVLSVEAVWSPSSLRVDPSSLVYPPEAEGVDMQWTREGDLRLTLRSDGTPGTGSVGIRVRNRNSGETVLLPLFTVEKHLHLAIGGVRSSSRRLGLSEGSFGSKTGVSHTYFLGAADFASQYPGSEARRFSDWPQAALDFLPRFRKGGDLARLVKLAGRSGIYAKAGGYTTVYVSTSDGAGSDGIQLQLYAVHCFGDTAGASLEDFSPYHSFSGTGNNYIHIHDYGDLYPESKGWLPEMASGFAQWTDL